MASEGRVFLEHDAAEGGRDDPSSSWGRVLYSCFCPCVVIGEMRSKVSREAPFASRPCGVQVGCGGCAVCVGTGLCAAAGWPVSPLLACYVCLQRRELHRIYPSELRWVCGDQGYGLLWPAALTEHRDLVDKKERQGVLHYPWAYDLPPAAHESDASNVVPNQTLFIVGPSGSGKSTLLRKLCTLVGYEDRLHQHNYIDIKITAVLDGKDGPFTLEIWDIPEKCIETSLKYKPDFVFLTYDSGDKDSLSVAQSIYAECAENWRDCKSIHLIATKIDTWESYGDDDIGPYEQTGAQWRAACIELAIAAEQWSKHNKALHFSLVSNPMNEGVRKLLKEISYK